jgi:lipopolysaccharide/colanic/teichoic acid biosynthesis glycosyltransferase
MAPGRSTLFMHQLGLVLIVLGFAQLHGRVLAPEPYDVLESPRLPWTLLYLTVMQGASYTLGLPELQRTRFETVTNAVAATLTSVIGVSLVQAVLGTPLLPRSVVGLSLLVVPLWSLLLWNLAVDLDLRSAGRDRVFLVCDSDEDVAALEAELGAEPERPALLVGSFSAAGYRRQEIPGALRRSVRSCGATLLVLDAAAQADPVLVHEAGRLHGRGMRVRTLSLFYEEWLGKIPVTELEKVAMLFDIGEVHRDRYSRLKRLLDVAIAVPALLSLVPVGVFLLVLNPFFNRGPLLYRQSRVGKRGVLFDTLKFRTMRPCGSSVAEWTTVDDPRVTPLGRWMRRSHLDELPQLVNIVRGDLALVGPRPEQPHYVEELQAKLPFYESRLLVRPGLTGWAQVKFGYASNESDALEKLQYDLFYLRRQNLTLDLRIMVRTARHLFRRGGR